MHKIRVLLVSPVQYSTVTMKTEIQKSPVGKQGKPTSGKATVEL